MLFMAYYYSIFSCVVILLNRKNDFFRSLAMCLGTAVLTLAVASAALLSFFGGREGLAFITKMNTVRSVVEEKFVGEVDWNTAADGASEGLIAALGDRWSYYMTAEELLSYRDRSNNSTTGIGVTVQADAEGRGLLVISVVTGSPADRAGIKAGCVLTAIAEQSIAGLDVSAVSSMIKAQTGEYSIEFLNEAGEECHALLSNEVVYTSPVEYEMLSGNIGYIRITDFEKGAAEDGIAAVEALESEGAVSLIFDVRANPGGQLTELIDLLDYLLPEGELFISVDSEGEEEIYYSEAGEVDLPMAVLIDANSYSAAEFFAAALREYDRAVIIGQSSTGKARSQQTFALNDGSAVHISTRNYLTPNRVNLAEEGGLVPDFEVALDGVSDTQLEKAVEYLS